MMGNGRRRSPFSFQPFEIDTGRFAPGAYSVGIGVAGAVGAVAAGEVVAGPLSTRSSMAIRNAMPKPNNGKMLTSSYAHK
jgi:hypothetical protein